MGVSLKVLYGVFNWLLNSLRCLNMIADQFLIVIFNACHRVGVFRDIRRNGVGVCSG